MEGKKIKLLNVFIQGEGNESKSFMNLEDLENDYLSEKFSL